MFDINDILNEAARESAQVFKYEYQATGYTNTGQSLGQIAAVDNTIVAPISIFTLVFGRRPGKYPPFGFVKGSETPTSLMQWCMDKFSETAKEARSTSFLIARKIATEGNRVYRGAVPPVPTEGTIDKANNVVFSRVLENFTETIKAYDLQ
jgi:hypothetical protein